MKTILKESGIFKKIKVKNFIRSFGNGAKKDPLDSKALALYGYEIVND